LFQTQWRRWKHFYLDFRLSSQHDDRKLRTERKLIFEKREEVDWESPRGWARKWKGFSSTPPEAEETYSRRVEGAGRRANPFVNRRRTSALHIPRTKILEIWPWSALPSPKTEQGNCISNSQHLSLDIHYWLQNIPDGDRNLHMSWSSRMLKRVFH